MSNEVYSIWKDEMRNQYIGALGGEDGVLDIFGTVKVPDGLWAVFGKIDLENDTMLYQQVDVRLHAKAAVDRRVIQLGPKGKLHRAALSLMLLEAFPGNDKKRKNEIHIGIWNHYEKPSQTPKIKGGRIKIIAMRLNHFINESYPPPL